MPESPQGMQVAYLLCIDLPYACFGAIIDTETDRCVRVAPIGGWMLGMTSEKISQWVSSKGGSAYAWGQYEHRSDPRRRYQACL